MAKADDIAAQLELTNQLNKALERQLELQSKLNAGTSKQAQLMGDMTKAASKGGADGIQKRIADQRKLTSEIENTRKKSADMTNELQRGMKKQADSIGGAQKALGGIGNFMKSWKGLALGAVGGILGGVTKMMSGITGLVKGAFAIITSVVKSAMGVVKALIMAPFKLMDAFNGIANEMHRINTVINGARQAVKGMIGDHGKLSGITGKAYKVALKAVKTLPGGMFGPREQGAAERIKMAGELVKAFGPYQEQLAGLSEQGAKFAIRMHKSLGFTDENFKTIVTTSKAFGEDVNEEFEKITLTVGSMASEMGLNVKTLGADFNAFYAKLKPMTGMSVQRIAEITGAFKKMGISGDKALGMFDKFEDLDAGSEAVSKLSRSMGIHLSQTQMILARGDTLKQLEIVQDAMRQSGKTFETLTYDGKKMLTEMFGGDQQTVMAAFGQAGMDSADSIEKAAKAAKKAKDAKNMPKIMARIDRSIQGIADSFGEIMKPMKAFMTGFMRGMNDGKFVSNMMSISKTFEKMGTSFGKFFKKTGFLEKISTMLEKFATKLAEVMPLVEELLQNLFMDQKASDRSAWEIIKNISSKLLGAYSGFYNEFTRIVILALQKVVPIIINTVGFLVKSLNQAIQGALTGDYSALNKTFSGMADDVTFPTKELNKEWKKLGEVSSKTFNDNFVKKQKQWVATNGKMKFREAGMGEALMANLGEALKRGAKKLAKILAEVVAEALGNLWDMIPQPVKYAIGIAAGAAIGGMIGGPVGAAIGAALGAVGAAVDHWFNDTLPSKEGWVRGHREIMSDVEKLTDAKFATIEGKLNNAKEILAQYDQLVGNTLAGEKTGLSEGAALIMQNVTKMQRTATEEKEAVVAAAKTAETAYTATNTGREENLKYILEHDVDEYAINQHEMSDAAWTMFQDLRGMNGASAQKAAAKKIMAMQARAKRANTSLGKGVKLSYSGRDTEAHLENWLGYIANLDDGSVLSNPTRYANRMLGGASDVKDQGDRIAFEDSAGYGPMLTLMVQEYDSWIKYDTRNQAQEAVTNFKASKDEAIRAEINKITNLSDMQVLMAQLTDADQTDGAAFEQLAANYAKARENLTPKLIQKEIDAITADEKQFASFEKQARDAKMTPAAFIRGIAAGRVKALFDAKKTLKSSGITIQNAAAILEEEPKKTKTKVGKAITKGAAMLAGMGLTAAGAYMSGGDIPQSIARPDEPIMSIDPKTDTKGVMSQGGKHAQKVVGKKTVPVKPLKKVKRLGRLPPSVLRLLANKKTAKRMFDAGLELTSVLNQMQPAADSVSQSLNSVAVPALQNTATAAQQATQAIATTVVMLGYVHDKLNEIQTTYARIRDVVVDVKKKSKGLKGKSTESLKTDTGVFTLNVMVNVDSKQMALALENTKVVSWSGKVTEGG